MVHLGSGVVLGEALGELLAEEDVGQLGLGVALPRQELGRVPLPVQVVQADRLASVAEVEADIIDLRCAFNQYYL